MAQSLLAVSAKFADWYMHPCILSFFLTLDSYATLKRYTPVGAPLLMKKERMEATASRREDDQWYTRASVLLKRYFGVWMNYSMAPPLLQQW